MIIIVDDPSVANPVPAEVVVSPDGQLAAWRTQDGIQLRANFQAADGTWPARRTNLCTRPSLSFVTGLTSGGAATLSVDSAWAVAGATSARITPNGTLPESALYIASAARPTRMAAGRTYTVSAYGRTNAAQTGTLHPSARRIVVGYISSTDGAYNYSIAESEALPNTAGAEGRVSVTVTMPADTDLPLVRLMNGSANTGETVSWDAVLIEEGPVLRPFFHGSLGGQFQGEPTVGYTFAWTGAVDDSASIADPEHPIAAIQFRRAGQPIRSGHDRVAVAATANAFDHEAPLDRIVTYQAFPVDADGNLGDPSDEIAIASPGLRPGKQGWIKSTNTPTLAMQLEVQGDPEVALEGRDTLAAVPGRGLMAGGVDTMVASQRSLIFKTYTHDECEQLLEILRAGHTLLIQLATAAGQDDFYAVCAGATIAYFRGSGWPERLITAEFKPTAKPTTLDTPLVIPGRSFDDGHATAPTFDDWLRVFPTFDDPLGIPPEAQK